MPNRFFPRLIVALVLVATASPASAAVTLRGLLLDDSGPRPSWFERYQDSREGPETVDKTSRTFQVGDGAALDLTGIAGDVRVTGGGGHEIRVAATRRVRHRSADEAKRLLNELRVEMTSFNGRVEVRSVYPRRGHGDRGFSGRIDYVVAVPTGASVAVKSISGDVIVSGVRGEVRAESISGDVSIDSAPNLVLAKTVSGDVTTRDAGGATTMVLSTVSGSVIASGLQVRTLQAGSVSGNVRLSGTQVERVEAKSVSGNIDFDAPLLKAGRYAFTSHSGNVRIILSGNTGFELDADTFSGSVRSDVPVTLRTMGRNDPVQRRGSSNRAIRGAYGDASALVSVRSHSGSVVITKK